MEERRKLGKSRPPIVFEWEGLNNNQRKITGDLVAENLAIAKSELRRQGVNVVKIRRKPKPLFTTRKPAIRSMDIAVFSRVLATMMSSGVPLMQSLQIIGEGHENPSMKTLVLALKSEVESGSTLTQALRRFPRQFDDLYINLVHAGEQSGTLERLLDEISTYLEKTEALKAKIKKALVYPTAIVTVAFVVTSILMIFVIPQFESLFAGFGADLPTLTVMVIQISAFFQTWWWVIFGAIGVGIVGFVHAKRESPKLQYLLDQNLLKLPVIGPILNKGAIARFARTFATMFKAGVPMVEAMESVAGATGNKVFAEVTLQMRDEVSNGTQLNQTMQYSGRFPNVVTQMVLIGEESGSLDAMLAKVADFYEREVDDAIDNMTALMEPLIMAFLGGLIGTLVIAMYLPIFKLGAVV